jgi:hypothetical protein
MRFGREPIGHRHSAPSEAFVHIFRKKQATSGGCGSRQNAASQKLRRWSADKIHRGSQNCG